MSYQRRSLLKLIVTGGLTVSFPLLTASLSACETHSKVETVTHTVEIKQFKFVPETVVIKAGDTIKWINRDLVPHTATASDNSWDTGEIKTNESKSLTFSKDAVSTYFCFYHPTMKAGFQIKMRK